MAKSLADGPTKGVPGDNRHEPTRGHERWDEPAFTPMGPPCEHKIEYLFLAARKGGHALKKHSRKGTPSTANLPFKNYNKIHGRFLDQMRVTL